MLAKFLYFLVLVLVFRLAVRMVRLLFSSPHAGPASRTEGGHPARGHRVVDVDYTED